MCTDSSRNFSGDSTKRSKQAESRMANTKAEVNYLASAYYDCAQFVLNSGINDLGVVNKQFEQMISVYVNAGKIKRESYNKFRTIANNTGYTSLKNGKEAFVASISEGFDNGGIAPGNGGLQNMQRDFMEFLKKYNVVVPDKMKIALFIELGQSLSQLYDDPSIKDYFDKLASFNGLGNVEWKGPQVVTIRSDGCSGSRDVHGSLWRNRDKAL